MPLTLVEYMNALNEQYGNVDCERFVKLEKEIKNRSENEQCDDGAYLHGSIDFNLYTVLPDGSFEKTGAHGYVYDDEDFMTVSSDKSMEYISELGRMLTVRKVGISDIKPGAMLLYVQYYEDRQVPTIHYYGTEYSVMYTGNTTQSDYGWYIVDERAAELIKKLSMEKSVEIEK